MALISRLKQRLTRSSVEGILTDQKVDMTGIKSRQEYVLFFFINRFF